PRHRALQGSGSKLQAPLAGALGERLDAAVVAVATAIEDARLDVRLLGALGEHLAGLLRLLHRVELAKVALGPAHLGDRAAGVVVDQLREHAAVRAVHREARALGAAAHLRAHAAPAAQTAVLLREHGHARLPTLRRTCSPA